jgi:phenylacetate-CoA ligase
VTTTALNLHSDLYQVINGMQYVQEGKGELTVLLVKSSSYTPDHEASLYRHFRSRLHPDTVVTIRYVDRLLRKPNGKFVHIISSVDTEASTLAGIGKSEFREGPSIEVTSHERVVPPNGW